MGGADSLNNPSLVAVVTSTYYPKWYRGKLRSTKHTDKVRGDLALELIQKAKALGFHVVVADANSRRTFRSTLSGISGIKIINRRSPDRTSDRLKAIKAASKIFGVKAIVMTEPEKISLIGKCVPLIVKPILNKEADIIVPKRDPKLFQETYPDYQYESEIEVNAFYNEALRANGLLSYENEDFDIFFGPRVLCNERRTISLFAKGYIFDMKNSQFSGLFKPGVYSETLYFPIVLALKKNFRVKNVTVPFSYPIKQKENEEKCAKNYFIEKRKTQRLDILMELIHFLSYLDKNPASRLKLIKK